jgi:uncharacterized protein (DUF433 family)
MTAIEEARSALQRLTPDERQNLLESLAREPVEVAPGIFRTPGVCGGEACVRAKRLPVWLLEEGRQRGATDEQLLRAHPGLTREDLAGTWSYVAAHRVEIDRLIRENGEV